MVANLHACWLDIDLEQEDRQASPVMPFEAVNIPHSIAAPLSHAVEAALHQQGGYQQTIARLQALVGEAIAEVEPLLTTLIQETIQFTLDFVQESHSIGSGTTGLLSSDAAHSPIDKQPVSEFDATELPEKLNTVSITEASPQKAQPSKTKTHQPASQDSLDDPSNDPRVVWERGVRTLGQELKRLREARSLSLEQLSQVTYIPVYKLVALETGQLNQPSEAIFMRGFIQRIAPALGVSGDRLLAQLPSPTTLQPVIKPHPSSSQRLTTPLPSRGLLAPGLEAQSMYLYVGYAALMAGAVGRLAWLAHEAPKPLPAEALIDPSAQVSLKESGPTLGVPGLKTGSQGTSVGQDMAPPEMF